MKKIERKKAGALLFDDTYIYLVYRERFNDYSLPKWHIEKWETPEQAVYREILEETGFIGNIIGYLDRIAYSFEKDWIINNCIVHYYLMKAINQKNNRLASDVDSVIKVPQKDIYNYLSYEEDKFIVDVAMQKFTKEFTVEENSVK